MLAAFSFLICAILVGLGYAPIDPATDRLTVAVFLVGSALCAELAQIRRGSPK